MASGALRSPTSFPSWFTAAFQALPTKPRVEIGRFWGVERVRALDRQRLVRQYRASLRRFVAHPHGDIERRFRIVAEIKKDEYGTLVVEMAAYPKQSPMMEALESWQKSLG